MATSKVAPWARFKYSRTGPFYQVSYDDIIFTSGHTVSEAKSIAGRLNKVLAVGGKMRKWDVAAFLQAWQLAAGRAVAGQGFTPPWVAG